MRGEKGEGRLRRGFLGLGRLRGLGDLVEIVAKPIAKPLGWPGVGRIPIIGLRLRVKCLDLAGRLKPGCACARRRAPLNAWMPFRAGREK